MERAAYEQFVRLEQDHFWFRGRRTIFFDLLDRQLANRGTLRVMELGCGAGGMLRRLSAYGPAAGVEIDLEIAEVCRESSGAPTVCADGYALPFADASLDVVCLFDTLEHLPDEGAALQEIHRVLRPGGIAWFSVPAYQFLYANNDRVARHCRRYTRRRLTGVVTDNGFELVRSSYFNSILFPPILVAVLAGKLKERRGRLDDPDHTNLSFQPRSRINDLLARVMGSERHLLRHVDLPVGHSLIGVFTKPAA